MAPLNESPFFKVQVLQKDIMQSGRVSMLLKHLHELPSMMIESIVRRWQWRAGEQLQFVLSQSLATLCFHLAKGSLTPAELRSRLEALEPVAPPLLPNPNPQPMVTSFSI